MFSFMYIAIYFRRIMNCKGIKYKLQKDWKTVISVMWSRLRNDNNTTHLFLTNSYFNFRLIELSSLNYIVEYYFKCNFKIIIFGAV